MRRAVPRLHAVTSDEILARADLLNRAAALAHPGVALHLRGPGTSGRALWQAAGPFAGAAHRGGAMALANDRVDIARLASMDGAHLPERGLPIDVTRRLLGEDALVGRSVHSAGDARRAADEGADYVFLGPIWDTASHPARPALGPGALRGLGGITVIAIGGVTPGRVAQCLEAGAYGVAAVSALWNTAEPGTVVEEMLVSLSGQRG